ncbi:P-loop containing nucleoside triphosphate hydrolase protein [Basidiobolus meristosporus CBS 931.73]|uniref:p-loop containing nucleoside triphosphate hydrolase protein n=1 Tax=Basidiobolus meristosporus CBS 931.73 TaxID=1314790 RepID=A0A1Y1YEB0_9FUNG|nr:P-loop containing nucleoside triphosphate hydrolase protein [Basidiobolus meristosporus CBS 931.73]|eukprot:ORX96337.1 P-loop containing nucleoside triphosphate hydrolase protein [Basidiobolus meristosporus CBS 931.73]
MDSTYCLDGHESAWYIEYLFKCHTESLYESIIPAFYGVLSVALILTLLIAFRKRLDYTPIGDSDSEDTISVSSQRSETDSLLGTSGPRKNQKLQLLKVSFTLLQLGVLATLFSIRWLEHVHGKKHSIASILSPLAGFVAWIYAVVLCFLNYFKVEIPGLSANTHLNGFYFVSIVSTALRIRLNLVEDNLSLNNAQHVMLLILLINSIVLFFVSISISGDGITKISKPSAKGVLPTPEESASILSLTTFSWMNAMIFKGYRKSIDMEDVYDLPENERSGYLCRKFDEESLELPNRSLSFRLIYFFRRPILIQLAYTNLIILFTFSGPYFLKRILDYLEHPELYSREMAYLNVFGLLFGYVALSLASSQSLWIGRKVGNGLKALIIGEVYAKSLRRQDVSGTAQEDNADEVSSLGKITNLMAVDAHKVAEICAYLNYLYALPMQIIITVVFLYQVIGWSAIAGSFAMMLTLPLNYYLVTKWAEIQDKLMAATDKRMSVINEVLQGIKIIKFFAWEDRFKSRVDESREKELVVLRERYIYWIFGGTLWFTSPAIVTIVTFYAYTYIAKMQLTASVAFASLALFKALQNPLDMLPDIISSIMQAKVSTDRVEKFLNEPDTNKYEIQAAAVKPNEPTIGFKNATISWFDPSNDSKDNCFSLTDISVVFPVGQLSLIAGPTGAGKSSMLMGLLGEMNLLEGSIYIPKRSGRRNSIGGFHTGVAYVSQQAWLQNDTIRNNILFGQPYDEKRYNEVIEACALERDLEILEGGDETEIGEKGIALSGGQKQRISLARAVYSRARHILMDDCLSAVDAHTAKHLFQKCIMGKLMKGRTRILVTHAVSLCMNGASLIVLLEQGAVTAQGKPEDLLSKGLLDQELLLEHEVEKNQGYEETDQGKPKAATDTSKKSRTKQAKGGKLITEETMARGSIKLQIYGSYLRECGGRYYWIFLLSLLGICQVLSFAQDYWIRVWVGAYDTSDSGPSPSLAVTTNVRDIPSSWVMGVGRSDISLYINANASSFDVASNVVVQEADTMYYIKMYLVLISVSVGFIMSRYATQFYGSLKASASIHSKLMSSILRAPMRFFDVTPVGRIMNRFSKDIECVDQEVSAGASIFLIDIVATFTVLGVISVITPQFLYAVVVIILVYVTIAKLYLSSSRELKRLESVTRSPIYTQFGETLTGVSTIRAFGEEKRFLNDNYSKIDTHLRPFIYLWAANRWLSTRVDIAGGFVAFFTALFLLQGDVDPNLAGLSLNYALNFTDHVLWCVRFYSVNEINMNSVERVREYMTIEQEPPAVIESERPPQGWPSKGEISVKNLVMQYAADQPPVIRDISFDVHPGEKIGIVGRTGAGKSTLAVAFFRFLEPASGTIFIDGVDIGKLGVQDLRSNLTIIPQDPVLFTGTIRSNLDPFNRCTDDELWMALKRVHLLESGDEAGKKNELIDLESPVSENGNNFSQGQRQLLALARALLKRSKLIILDEATASVDFETDAKIQATIRTEFEESTLLCIAHRLRTVVDYDRIIVMDHGKLVEYDTPYNLIQQVDSVFHSMCQKSGEFEVLLEAAKAKFGDVNN